MLLQLILLISKKEVPEISIFSNMVVFLQLKKWLIYINNGIYLEYICGIYLGEGFIFTYSNVLQVQLFKNKSN